MNWSTIRKKKSAKKNMQGNEIIHRIWNDSLVKHWRKFVTIDEHINIGSKKVGTNGLRYSSNNLEKTWRQHIKTRNSTCDKSVIFNIENIVNNICITNERFTCCYLNEEPEVTRSNER